MTVHFTKDHEWMKIEADIAWIGITTYARHALGDLVYLELPETGRNVSKGEHFAVVESVKAASEIYTPVSGDIIEVNNALSSNLDDLKEDIETGWIVKIKMSAPSEVSNMMDKTAYDQYISTLD
jgi:glycine cleavage system H protein